MNEERLAILLSDFVFAVRLNFSMKAIRPGSRGNKRKTEDVGASRTKKS